MSIFFSVPSVYNDVESRINTFRTMLQTKLLELPTPLEEQKKLIRLELYLIINLLFLAQTQCHFRKSSQTVHVIATYCSSLVYFNNT